MRKIHEGVSRSILKAISFRSLILMSDGVIIFVITHRFDVALEVIIFSNIASTLLYILHERLWNHIQWGRSIKKK